MHVHICRWAATQVLALEKIIQNIYPLTEHLEKIMNDDENFEDDTRNRAKQELVFLRDKNALAAIMFNLDPMNVFKELSLHFQERHSSLVGQKSMENVLRMTMEDFKNENGDNFKNFLKSATCFKKDFAIDGAPCNTLQNYETHSVYYNGIVFKENDLVKYPRLSTFLKAYIDALLVQIDKFFPSTIGRSTHPSKIDFQSFEVLNQNNYPTEEKNKLTFQAGSIEEVAKLCNVDYDNQLQKEFDKLVRQVIFDKEIYCKTRASDSLFFWSNIVESYKDMLSPKMKQLLLAANVTPLSSSDPERR